MKSDRPPSFALFISLPAVSFDAANYRSLTVQERKKYKGRGEETGRGKQREGNRFRYNEIRQRERKRHTHKNRDKEGKSLNPAHSMLIRV